MTPEEIENQFSALSSPNQNYSQERVISFSPPNTFRGIFSREAAKSQRLRSSWLSSFTNLLFPFFQSLSSGFKFGVGFVLAIFTVSILAVTVSGTFNTFSSGALLKSSDINANFATLKAAIESIPSQPSMRLIYETDVTTASQTVTISGLDGNTDIEYQIKMRIIGNCTSNLNIQLNGDATTTNYGIQDLYGGGTGNALQSQSTSAAGLSCGGLNAGIPSSCNIEFIAKTGSARLATSMQNQDVSGTTMAYYRSAGTVWNNSSSNITSMTIYTSIASCIAAGSHIEVWARR